MPTFYVQAYKSDYYEGWDMFAIKIRTREDAICELAALFDQLTPDEKTVFLLSIIKDHPDNFDIIIDILVRKFKFFSKLSQPRPWRILEYPRNA